MEIISVSETDLEEIEGYAHRTFCAASTPLTAEVILNDIQRARRKRVIVICNTVSKSQALFRDLVALDGDEVGKRATDEIALRLARRAFVRIATIPHGRQPDDLPEEELKAILGSL